MLLTVLAVLAQIHAARVTPVLAFPEAGLDDTAAYQGYRTRLYRDSRRNTIQIYLEPRSGRVVHLWADAANESLGFTARDARGAPAQLEWGDNVAQVFDSAGTRTVQYRLSSRSRQITVGWFLLGSMRVERDFQYARGHLRPFTAPAFHIAEESLLVANIGRLPAPERDRQLALLRAGSIAELRARLQPALGLSRAGTVPIAWVQRPSLDGRNYLLLELRADPRTTAVRVGGRTVSLEARGGGGLRFAVRVATDAGALTPLTREQIFNPGFLAYLAGTRAGPDTMARRRLEREVRGVELLSSEEKLMAGLPNFATYFGRDVLMTALMMRPIWSPAMSEHVIASVLRRLSPRGDVSHEEALAGQAIRENAAEYNALLADHFRLARQGRRTSADSILDQARELLRDLQRTRENYHMLDDEFQLPVLEARYLADSTVTAQRKRDFLLADADSGVTRVALMLREMALVAEETRPYVRNPGPTTLVGFVRRDSTHWRSASWRDSDAGYANGRFAMDINAIWAPRALEAIAAILAALPSAGVSRRAIDSLAPEVARGALGEYLDDTTSLRRAIEVWKGARRHFTVTLGQEQLRRAIGEKLAWLPRGERRFWESTMGRAGEVSDPLTFLALSLDGSGRPIPIVNTDPATELFLGDSLTPDVVLGEVEPFIRPYPVGLYVERLGPVVANDAYAPRRVWEVFRTDAYQSPRVVWGREVNLFLLGLAERIAAAGDDRALEPFRRVLLDALHRTLAAVDASGLAHNELWSYRIADGRLLPTRYGTSSDVQLWSTTDLAVQFALSRLPPLRAP